MRRTRLLRAASASGVGVHSGTMAHVTVQPAPWGTGLVFCLPGPSGGEVPVGMAQARARQGQSRLELGGWSVDTPEHLLAALCGLGVTDAHIGIEGDEVPILDGSARVWTEQLLAAGLEHGDLIEPIVVRDVVRVEDGDAWATLEPYDGCEVVVEVDYGQGYPSGSARVHIPSPQFVEEVAWARTFVMASDVDALRAMGRGRGAGMDNTVVLEHGGAVNAEGLRAPDEPVRHKLLDAIGDLALVGCPVQGRMTVHRGGHRLHHALLRTWWERIRPRTSSA